MQSKIDGRFTTLSLTQRRDTWFGVSIESYLNPGTDLGFIVTSEYSKLVDGVIEETGTDEYMASRDEYGIEITVFTDDGNLTDFFPFDSLT